MSKLQDKYHARLTSKGYNLERGIKGSDRKHIKIKDYKKANRKLEQNLKTRNSNLLQENNKLKSYLESIIQAIKLFFRELLQVGNDKVKEATTNEIKDYYDNQGFNSNDVYGIVTRTTKKDKLFGYVKVPSYLKTSKKSCNDKDKYDYEISM